jgi:Recombination endonuclease VII
VTKRKRNNSELEVMADYGRVMLREKTKKLQKKSEELTDDEFMKYLRKNTIYKSKYKEPRPPANVTNLIRRENKVGRSRPAYCELHEALLLNPRSSAPPVADHNHETGVYRGWICNACNSGIIPVIDYLRSTGIDRDDIKVFLSLAVDYVFTDGKVLESRLK